MEKSKESLMEYFIRREKERKMPKWKSYKEYTCSCGNRAGHSGRKQSDGTYAPYLLNKEPSCTTCYKDAAAKKSGFKNHNESLKALAIKQGYTSHYDKLNALAIKQGFLNINHKTSKGKYTERKYIISYCENNDDKLGFSCAMKEDFFDGSEISIKILEVDHIDGNPSNNIEANLMVLCPCCHKRKGWNNSDSATPGRKSLGIKSVGKMLE